MKKSYVSLLTVLLIGTNVLYAKTGHKSTTSVSQKVKKDNIIDLAGRQRMLSQRIVKDYLYKGNKVAVGRADKELKTSLGEFNNALKKLDQSINDAEIKNLLSFVQMSFDEFKDTVSHSYDQDNAQIALDLGESLLEGSQYVVDSLKSKQGTKGSKNAKIIAKSGKQRMLAQRIAKYYIAYQSGIKDKNTVDQMKSAVKEFDANHKELMAYKGNSTTINQKLHDVDKLWKIVYKFYLGIEKGGLPFIVFKTTNDITKKMNEITKLYATH
ncbi:MAG: hypothetical protein DSZ06_03180 [Sulfurospirillum sp.]|nr:MAG: hypothetical protein DSZ06_03180 [Sulfurospirillum sp.]